MITQDSSQNDHDGTGIAKKRFIFNEICAKKALPAGRGVLGAGNSGTGLGSGPIDGGGAGAGAPLLTSVPAGYFFNSMVEITMRWASLVPS
jgi:hypothetical protein